LTDASLVQQVRLHVFGEAAATGRVPQRGQIAAALRVPEAAVQEALRELASRLARASYGGKLSPAWRRHTLEETEALLADVGLTGPFWNLRPGGGTIPS
jgi:hypothetical protein